MTTTLDPMTATLEAFDHAGRRRKADGAGGFLVSCPGPNHDRGDRNPSLHLSTGRDGRVLLTCYAGCDTGDILHAVGLAPRDLFVQDPEPFTPAPRRLAVVRKDTPEPPSAPVEACTLAACERLRASQSLGECVARYTYTDADGRAVGQVHRYDPKTFRPFTPDARGAWKAGGRIPPVPFDLPRVLAVLANGGTVLVVEGEKDAQRINTQDRPDLCATTNAGGAGKWTVDHAAHLANRGGVVVVVGDTDAAGQAHAAAVADTFVQLGDQAPAVMYPTRGKDLSEHLDNGGTFDEIEVPDDGKDTPEVSSWTPTPLDAILDGTHEPEVPTLLPRTDGHALLYPGRLHSFHGESESGKSLAIQAEAARLLTLGQRVLIVDFESDAPAVVGRLRALGASVEDIRRGLVYLRPDESLRSPAAREALDGVLSQTYALAVIDGVTEALGLLTDGGGKPEEQIVAYMRALPRRIARRTGAAVVQVDHVAKNADTRGRHALGSQHKLNALDGAAYVVEVVEPLGLGLRGVLVLRVAKDRPGSVRPHAGAFRKTDRTQEAARIVVDATEPGRTVVTVEGPSSRVGETSTDPEAFRPTALMERASLHLEGLSEPASAQAVATATGGRKQYAVEALDLLVVEGFVERTDGPRGSKLHASVRPYRQALDPRSDRYAGREQVSEPETPSAGVPTCSPPKGVGNREQVEHTASTRSGNRSGTGREQREQVVSPMGGQDPTEPVETPLDLFREHRREQVAEQVTP